MTSPTYEEQAKLIEKLLAENARWEFAADALQHKNRELQEKVSWWCNEAGIQNIRADELQEQVRIYAEAVQVAHDAVSHGDYGHAVSELRKLIINPPDGARAPSEVAKLRAELQYEQQRNANNVMAHEEELRTANCFPNHEFTGCWINKYRAALGERSTSECICSGRDRADGEPNMNCPLHGLSNPQAASTSEGEGS